MESKDMTMGTGKMYKRLALVAYKYTGEITEEDKAYIRKTFYHHLTNGGAMVSTSVDGFGHGVLLVFDAYMVVQLSPLKRLRHSLRVLTTAIASYIGMRSIVKVVRLK